MRTIILALTSLSLLIGTSAAFAGNCWVKDKSLKCDCEKEAQARLCPKVNELFNKFGHVDYLVHVTSSSDKPDIFVAVVMADMYVGHNRPMDV